MTYLYYLYSLNISIIEGWWDAKWFFKCQVKSWLIIRLGVYCSLINSHFHLLEISKVDRAKMNVRRCYYDGPTAIKKIVLAGILCGCESWSVNLLMEAIFPKDFATGIFVIPFGKVSLTISLVPSLTTKPKIDHYTAKLLLIWANSKCLYFQDDRL
jgi:hypothetical protein